MFYMFGLQRGLNFKLQKIKIYNFKIEVYNNKKNFNSKCKKDRNKSILLTIISIVKFILLHRV